MWKYKPNFKTGIEAWIYAGGAHHTVVSSRLTVQDMVDLANMWGMEAVVIDENTEINEFKRQLMLTDIIYRRK